MPGPLWRLPSAAPPSHHSVTVTSSDALGGEGGSPGQAGDPGLLAYSLPHPQAFLPPGAEQGRQHMDSLLEVKFGREGSAPGVAQWAPLRRGQQFSCPPTLWLVHAFKGSASCTSSSVAPAKGNGPLWWLCAPFSPGSCESWLVVAFVGLYASRGSNGACSVHLLVTWCLSICCEFTGLPVLWM